MNIDQDVIDAVTKHMNEDHTDDSLTIVRAFATPEAAAATMVGLDNDGGDWVATLADGSQRDVRLDWPIEINERRDIRLAVVELYNEACSRLDAAE